MGFQTWATPPTFIEWCQREVLPNYGYTDFGLDACAEPHNAKASHFLAPVGRDLESTPGCVGVDGLNASWGNYGAVWCNPGFSDCARWLAKAREELENGVTSLVLTHATHTSGWYHEHKWLADRWLISPRINFLPPIGVTPSSNTRDSLLWVYSPTAGGDIIEPGSWRRKTPAH